MPDDPLQDQKKTSTASASVAATAGDADEPIFWVVRRIPTQSVPASMPKVLIFTPPLTATNAEGVVAFYHQLSELGFATSTIAVSQDEDVRRIFAYVDQASFFVTIANSAFESDRNALGLLRAVITYASTQGKRRHYGLSLDGAVVEAGRVVYIADASEARLPEDAASVVGQIANTYYSEAVGVAGRAEVGRERRERLEQNAAVYVDEALASLQIREVRWKRAAHIWHALGITALLSGVLAMVLLSMKSLDAIGAANRQWPLVAYVALKSILLIGLLGVVSKYAFTLGRLYMNEALKTADRAHAINFGRFYLKAYGESLPWNEVKEVFRHWNIATEAEPGSIDTSHLDPQVLSTIVAVTRAMSSIGSGSK